MAQHQREIKYGLGDSESGLEDGMDMEEVFEDMYEADSANHLSMRRKYHARRALEEYLEKKRLQEDLTDIYGDVWDDEE